MKSCKVFLMAMLVLIISAVNALSATKKPEVTVGQVQTTEVEKNITFPAITKSQKQSNILAETSGVIRKINKQLGQEIKKGEVISWIENPDPVYQYKPLAIRSPISGKLTKIQITEGALVEKGMPVFTVTDPNSIVIEVQVPAKDVTSLKIGSKAFFTDSSKKEVKLVGLSPAPDTGTLTSLAIFEFKNPKDKNIPGVQGFIDYTASSRKIILLPETSLVRRNGKVFIRKFTAGKMNLVEVKIGERYEDQVEIASGIEVGEEFIERTSQHIKDGEEVTKISQ